jgi:colicin import membrane protein
MNNKPVLTHKTDQESRQWTAAIGASVALHIVLFLAIALFSQGTNNRAVPMKYIDVDLAMASAVKDKTAPKPKAQPQENIPVKKKTVQKKKTSGITKPVKKTSLAPKKTTKPKKDKSKTVDKVLDRLEKDLASSSGKPDKKTDKKTVDPIAERLKQMEKETREPQAKKTVTGTGSSDEKTGESPFEASLIDRYRINVSVEIKENWAFSKALAAGQTRLETLVSFEVLPDGVIRGVRILRRSGNDYMDNAATVAILKSSPVRPHPPGINKPFIEIKLRFTPEGLE